MTRSHRSALRGLALLALLGLLALGAGGAAAMRPAPEDAAPAAARPVPALVPRLTDVSAATADDQVFTVAGAGFTAGGRVYLAIYDELGARLYETRWVLADAAGGTAIGSGNGFERPAGGGALHAAFAGLCGATAMMRALDATTDVWSNWLSVHPPACATQPSGPDGADGRYESGPH